VPEALRQAGLRVEVHDDHFPPDASDADWLRAVGQRGWVVLTKDERIRRRPLKHAALLDAGVRAFVLGTDMGQAFVRAGGAMENLLRRRRQRPFIATVTRRGRVRVIVK